MFNLSLLLTVLAFAKDSPPPIRNTTPHGNLECIVFQSRSVSTGPGCQTILHLIFSVNLEGVCFRIHIERHWRRTTTTTSFDTSTSINLNKLYIQSKQNISASPYIKTYIRIPIHVTGLLISMWGPANSFFLVRQICHAHRKAATCRLRTKNGST